MSIFEFFFLLIAIILYLVQNRTLVIEQTNPSSKFIIAIENNGKLKNNRFDYKFPFDSKIKTDKNYVISQKLPDDINLISPKSWNDSYYYNIYNYKDYPKVVVFGIDKTEGDSLKILNFIQNHIK